jgi:EAL domain-containing protein (putative c-di-GMP-specific phosphodiesterase class I)
MYPDLDRYLLQEDTYYRRQMLQLRPVSALELKQGLARHQFIPYFQPVVHAASGAVHSLQATVRWLHPERGVLLPCDFLCEADQYGLLEQVTWKLAATALQAALAWREQGDMTPVALHLSGARLRGAPFGERLSAWLDARGLPAGALAFEPRPASLASGVETILDWYRLQEAGFQLASGDFICEALPAEALPAALQRWHGSHSAIHAVANLPDSCFY